MALIDKLTAIADGFRASRGTTTKYTLDQMAVLASEPISGGTNDSIIGIWLFNDILTPIPEELFGKNIYFRYSVYASWVDVNAKMDRITIFEEGTGFSYNGDEGGDNYCFEDVYEYSTGWLHQDYKTITITEAPTDPTFIAWLKANATKLISVSQTASAYNVSSVDELPSNAVDGSMAIVESDSIVGKWEWKDNESMLDFSMLELPTDLVTDTIAIHGAGTDGTLDVFSSIFFTKDTGSPAEDLTLTMGEYDIYVGGSFDDAYKEFVFYSEPNYENCIIITDVKFKKFLKTNCNRLSGGNSLYIRQNGQWVYKGEVA